MLLFLSFLVGIGFGFVLSRGDGLGSGDKVAVLRIIDIIIDSQTYLDSLSAIRKDKRVKAVVVRINSPGGAVGPSQEIFSEIKKLRDTMPVIASMGAIGASGGYYIACAAEKIYANPGTITGSIGVIAQFVSYKDLLNWAKVDVEVIKSGEYKDIGSPFREMTTQDKAYIQQLIENVNSQFKQAVSEARGIKPEDIDNIAEGKIYTGQQAKELNLIDELGTLGDAISLAASMAGIEGEPNVVYYPKTKSPFLDLLLSKIGFNGLTRNPVGESFGLFYLVDIIH